MEVFLRSVSVEVYWCFEFYYHVTTRYLGPITDAKYRATYNASILISYYLNQF